MAVRFAQWWEQGWHNDEGKVVAVVRTSRRRMLCGLNLLVIYVSSKCFPPEFVVSTCSL